MTLDTLLIIFACLVAVFLCLIVPTLLYLRQMSMKSDIARLEERMDVVKREYATFCEQSSKIYDKVTDVEAKLHAAETRDLSTQETIRALSNKINSRTRAQRKAEQQELPTVEGGNEIDFESMQEQYPGAVLPLQPKQNVQEASPPVRERRFGEMP